MGAGEGCKREGCKGEWGVVTILLGLLGSALFLSGLVLGIEWEKSDLDARMRREKENVEFWKKIAERNRKT